MEDESQNIVDQIKTIRTCSNAKLYHIAMKELGKVTEWCDEGVYDLPAVTMCALYEAIDRLRQDGGKK